MIVCLFLKRNGVVGILTVHASQEVSQPVPHVQDREQDKTKFSPLVIVDRLMLAGHRTDQPAAKYENSKRDSPDVNRTEIA